MPSTVSLHCLLSSAILPLSMLTVWLWTLVSWAILFSISSSFLSDSILRLRSCFLEENMRLAHLSTAFLSTYSTPPASNGSAIWMMYSVSALDTPCSISRYISSYVHMEALILE